MWLPLVAKVIVENMYSYQKGSHGIHNIPQHEEDRHFHKAFLCESHIIDKINNLRLIHKCTYMLCISLKNPLITVFFFTFWLLITKCTSINVFHNLYKSALQTTVCKCRSINNVIYTAYKFTVTSSHYWQNSQHRFGLHETKKRRNVFFIRFFHFVITSPYQNSTRLCYLHWVRRDTTNERTQVIFPSYHRFTPIILQDRIIRTILILDNHIPSCNRVLLRTCGQFGHMSKKTGKFSFLLSICWQKNWQIFTGFSRSTSK